LPLKSGEFGGVERLSGFSRLGEAALHLLGTGPKFLRAILRAACGFPEEKSMFTDAGFYVVHAIYIGRETAICRGRGMSSCP
jgi:hypothetical protein